MNIKSFFTSNVLILIAAFLGILGGYFDIPLVQSSASVVSELFINLLKLVSLPIIFLSIVSTTSGMESLNEIKILGRRVLKYTLLTTVLAASIALCIFLLISPASSSIAVEGVVAQGGEGLSNSYLNYFMQIVPSNVLVPFVESNVIAVLFLALMLGISILSLPNEKREILHAFFSSLYAAVMKITSWVVCLMPLAVWAFVTIFIIDLKSGGEINALLLYLSCVILANLVQAFVVLPILLRWKGISPTATAKGMMPALSVAFFSKSSSAALPVAMRCAKEDVKLSSKVVNFSFPMCTTINMNGCAAFILTTVLFVSMSHGLTFSPGELILWILLATIAAVGNAGVPMGCFFLSSAFLAAMNVPLTLMGLILPFYSLIDMLESAINVWSDSCVATVVDKELAQENIESVPSVSHAS